MIYSLQEEESLVEDLTAFLADRMVAFYAFSNRKLESVSITNIDFSDSHFANFVSKGWFDKNEKSINKFIKYVEKNLGDSILKSFNEKYNKLCTY